MAEIKELVSNIKNLRENGIDTVSSLKKKGVWTAGLIGGAVGLGIGHSKGYNLVISAAVGVIISSVVYNYYVNKK